VHGALESDSIIENFTATTSGSSVAIWLLSVTTSHDSKGKFTIMEASAIEILTERISQFSSQVVQTDTEENGSIWVCALLLVILFQDRDIIHEPATMRAIPALTTLLKSKETANKYFAAQALASLVCNGSRCTLLVVANSGAASNGRSWGYRSLDKVSLSWSSRCYRRSTSRVTKDSF
jgi:hypothetical protein